MKTLDAVDAASLKTGLPDFRAGDTLKLVMPGRVDVIEVLAVTYPEQAPD